ncbi:MAG: RIP metalloprotease RseP [Bacteroidales bacterium]|nr:RIP metalloprotease RseP [Bacteroidales bacterium]
MNWLALILSLTILVATHELGHLAFAKLFHTRVRRYYIFFNWKFSILKAKRFDGKWHFLWFNATTPESWEEKNLKPEDQNNTLWGLGWIPLGGYCDIAGMIDETKDVSDLEAEPQPWEYRIKPAWQRLCIISGGVLVNFVTALLLYGAIFSHWGKDELPMHSATLGFQYHQVMLDEGFHNGDLICAIDGQEVDDYVEANKMLLLGDARQVTVRRDDTMVTIDMSGRLVERVNTERVKHLMTPRIPFVVKSFVAGSTAERAGMLPGDSVVSINGERIAAFNDITEALAEHKGETVTIGFYRDRMTASLEVEVSSSGKLGVQCETDIARLFPDIRHIDYTIPQAIAAGISHGWETLVTYVSGLKMLFAPGGAQNLGGFGAMASLFPDHWDWQAFWELTALLALILAFMNIIPIPGLDGGHILFTLWEIITRKKPSDNFLSYAQNVGMFLLLALMIFANGNDLWRWLSSKF